MTRQGPSIYLSMLLSPMWCLPLGSCWRGFSLLGISAAGTPLALGFDGGGDEQFECAHVGLVYKLVGVVQEAAAMGGAVAAPVVDCRRVRRSRLPVLFRFASDGPF